jgi:hypothetical protein
MDKDHDPVGAEGMEKATEHIGLVALFALTGTPTVLNMTRLGESAAMVAMLCCCSVAET